MPVRLAVSGGVSVPVRLRLGGGVSVPVRLAVGAGVSVPVRLREALSVGSAVRLPLRERVDAGVSVALPLRERVAEAEWVREAEPVPVVVLVGVPVAALVGVGVLDCDRNTHRLSESKLHASMSVAPSGHDALQGAQQLYAHARSHERPQLPAGHV